MIHCTGQQHYFSDPPQHGERCKCQQWFYFTPPHYYFAFYTDNQYIQYQNLVNVKLQVLREVQALKNRSRFKVIDGGKK